MVRSKTALPQDQMQLLAEEMLTIPQAVEELRQLTGQPINRSTIYRWVMRGVGGTKLSAVRVGKTVLTSRRAITAFIAQRSI